MTWRASPIRTRQLSGWWRGKVRRKIKNRRTCKAQLNSMTKVWLFVLFLLLVGIRLGDVVSSLWLCLPSSQLNIHWAHNPAACATSTGKLSLQVDYSMLNGLIEVHLFYLFIRLIALFLIFRRLRYIRDYKYQNIKNLGNAQRHL